MNRSSSLFSYSPSRWLRVAADRAASEQAPAPIDPTQLERLADFIAARAQRRPGKPVEIISELDLWERRIVEGARRYRRRTGCSIKQALAHKIDFEQWREFLDPETAHKLDHARMRRAMVNRRRKGKAGC